MSLLAISELMSGTSVNGSGMVTFDLPSPDGGAIVSVSGCLSESPSLKFGTNWQPLLPGLDQLARASQIFNGAGALLGSTNANAMTSGPDIISWIKGSQAGWTGSAPLEVSLSFYLFSIDSSSNIREKAVNFVKLAVPHYVSEASISVHGGYTPDFITADDGRGYINMSSRKGLVTVKIGRQLNLSQMLIQDVTPEYSSIEVPDGNPLYIRMTVGLRSYRVLYAHEIEPMLIGKKVGL